MASYRKETDSIGEIEVSEEVYWGAQTQRSLNNFKIADQKMPREIIKALALGADYVMLGGILNKTLESCSQTKLFKIIPLSPKTSKDCSKTLL